jgi:hypothetical protein
MDEDSRDMNAGIVVHPGDRPTKLDAVRRHYNEIGECCRPWTVSETTRIYDCIVDNETDLREVQEGLRSPRSPDTHHRSIVEIHDRYLILVLLISIEVRDPVRFLHARRNRGGRGAPAFYFDNPVWRKVKRDYVSFFGAYHGMAYPMRTAAAMRAAGEVLVKANLLIQEYLLFEAVLRGRFDVDVVDQFSYTYTEIRRDLDYGAPRVGWERVRFPFDCWHRRPYLTDLTDPDMSSFPVNYYRVLRLTGGANRAEAMARHYGRTLDGYLPFSAAETTILSDEITSYGGTDILRIERTMRDSPGPDICRRSLIEIHDRCVLLLALRAVGVIDPVYFLHQDTHECRRLSLREFIKFTRAYRDSFCSMNGYPRIGIAPWRAPHKIVRASYRAPSIAFRMLRDYHGFYSCSLPEMHRGIYTGRQDFSYHYCDLQQLALFLV